LLVCDIPKAAKNLSIARVWSLLSSLHQSNWKRSLRLKRQQRKVPGWFESKWRMVRRSLIQIIAVQYWIIFSIQSTTNLHTRGWFSQSGSWMAVWIANHKLTNSLESTIQFEAYLEQIFWCSKFGRCGSLWGDEFGIWICQECWWQMKQVLARLLSQWQQQWYANCWLRRLLCGCHCQFGRGISSNSTWI